MVLLNQWLAEKIEPVKYYYVVNGKLKILTEPICYFVWTNGPGTVEFGGHMTQSEYDAAGIARQRNRLPERNLKSKTLLLQSFL